MRFRLTKRSMTFDDLERYKFEFSQNLNFADLGANNRIEDLSCCHVH